MQVVLLTNSMVMVFADQIPAPGRPWCEGLDRMERYDAILPELLALPDEGITWMVGDWEEGRYLLTVTRDFIQSIVYGVADGQEKV